MKQQSTREETSSINPYEALESWARANVQDFIQKLLEEEMDAFIGRAKSERHVGSGKRVYRNGHGKSRNFGMMGGTVQVRRPRVRNAEERFESRILPLFHRKSKELGAMLPRAVSAWAGERGLRVGFAWPARRRRAALPFVDRTLEGGLATGTGRMEETGSVAT